MDPKLKLIMQGKPDEELQLLMRLKDPRVIPDHVKVITQFRDIISCRILRKHLLMVYDDEATFSLKAPKVIPLNKESREDSMDRHFYKRNSRMNRVMEKSKVVFGIIDFGFDFTHPDFLDADGNTRFEKIWVQSSVGGYPNKYGYGNILEEDILNTALQSAQPFKFAKYHPGRGDFMGRGMHGTHVLGIAAASGNVGVKGYAGDCSIIAVDMGANYVNGSDLSLGDSVKLIEGIDFILEQAAGRPCVINMSLGGHGDAHTGQTLVELALNNALKSRAGFAIVQSTGNYFDAKCHHSGILKEGESADIEWLFKTADRTANEMEIWYEGDDEFGIEIYDGNDLLKKADSFEEVVFSVDNEVDAVIFHRQNEPNTHKNQIDIILTGKPKVDSLRVRLVGNKVTNGTYHAYIERDDLGQSRFDADDVDTNYTTGSICNAPLVITVGAYDQKQEDKTPLSFSSAGPTVDGRMKPEVVAPGSKIAAARSASRFEPRASGKLTRKSGSSMAAPFVASLAVKILEQYPDLNIYALRNYLFKFCDVYETTSETITHKTGKGAINSDKLLQALHTKELALPRQ